MPNKTSPAIEKLNALAAEVMPIADAADDDPDFDFDDDYVMPSSMMQGTQIDVDQLPDAPKTTD